VGLEHLEQDSRFADYLSREKNAPELVATLDRLFTSRTREEWMALLRNKGLWACPVNAGLFDLTQDPQVVENEYIADYPHPVLGPVKFVGLPVRFARTPGHIQREAPALGQHTEEVLLELGYTWGEIAALKEQEVI
jgi:crotonobetainyl-CoA:carnitine CoA-transferase CaiB-like acyl-CoA transferase